MTVPRADSGRRSASGRRRFEPGHAPDCIVLRALGSKIGYRQLETISILTLPIYN
jgi:hypothetical protein